MPFERGEQNRIVLLARTGPGHHHAIQPAQLALALAEAFAREPLQAVARRSGFGDLAGNRQTQTRVSQIVGSGQHGKIAVARLGGLGEDAGESVPAGQPGAARETRVTGRSVQGAKRTRPLARRAFKTSRPPLVAIRARKP